MNKREKVVKRTLLCLPFDCLGEVCSFFGNHSKAFNLMRTCKSIYEYLTGPTFYCGFSNVVFHSNLWKLAKKFPGTLHGIEKALPDVSKLGFVRKLAIDYWCCPEETLSKFIRFFPRLEYLDVSQINGATDEVLKNLKLRELVICGCDVSSKCFENTPLGSSVVSISVTRRNAKCLRKRNEEVESWLPKLREIKFLQDRCFTLKPISVGQELLQDVPHVERISATQCTLVGEKPFSDLKNLRVLDISKCNSNVHCDISDSMIEDLENLEVLKMNNIQYFDSRRGSGISCGKISVAGFIKMKKLRHLELQSNWVLDPGILDVLPSLEVLNVADSCESVIQKAIGLDLIKLKVCLCVDIRPKKEKNKYKKAELEEDTCKRFTHYQCDECIACPRCEKKLTTCQLVRCVDCNIEYCKACREDHATMCEDCAEPFCGCERRTKFFPGYCRCEWERLCSKCLRKSYFAGVECDGCISDFGYSPMRCCNKCVNSCDTCGEMFCFAHTSEKFRIDERSYERIGVKIECKRCEKVLLETSPDCCSSCVEKKENELDIVSCESCGYDLCSGCAKKKRKCPSCERMVCYDEKEGKEVGCLFECEICDNSGCNKCLKMLVRSDEYTSFYSSAKEKLCDVCDRLACYQCREQFLYCSYCRKRDYPYYNKYCKDCAADRLTVIHNEHFCEECTRNCGKCQKLMCDDNGNCKHCLGFFCEKCDDMFLCIDCSEFCEKCENGHCKDHKCSCSSGE